MSIPAPVAFQRIDAARAAARTALVGIGIDVTAGAGVGVVRVGTAVLLAVPAEGVLVRVDDRVGVARAARHLAVGHALAGLGVPAVRPVRGVAAPVEVGGAAVTVWELERLVPGTAGPAIVGHLAGRLHRATAFGEAMADIDGIDPLRDVAEQLATAELSDDESAVLEAATDDVRRRWEQEVVGVGASGLPTASPTAPASSLGPWGIVHGDLHAGNVLLTRRGPLLADLELAGVGPVAYDLVAPVVAVLRYGAPASAIGDYARAYRAPIPAPARHGVLRDAYELWLTSWALANRHLDGAHGLEATRRLDRWRNQQRSRNWSLR